MFFMLISLQFLYVYLYSGQVEIPSAQLSHAGRYTCTAKNIAGSTQRHVQLTVQGKNMQTITSYNLINSFKIILKTSK